MVIRFLIENKLGKSFFVTKNDLKRVENTLKRQTFPNTFNKAQIKCFNKIKSDKDADINK